MLTLRQSPFDLFERLEQQLATAERVPNAEIRETETSYTVQLELPGVDRDSIDVKATDRNLVISAKRPATGSDDSNAPLLSEFRSGTWSRSFRFAQGLNREAISANYRDGVLEITAGKTQSHTSVTVAVDA
ncbi:MAG: Hsp20/alpha crystallin family protein [Synechococcus sp.]